MHKKVSPGSPTNDQANIRIRSAPKLKPRKISQINFFKRLFPTYCLSCIPLLESARISEQEVFQINKPNVVKEMILSNSHQRFAYFKNGGADPNGEAPHKRIRNYLFCVASRRLLLLSFLWLFLVPSCARSQNISRYAQDFFEATWTFETVLTPAATGAFGNYVTRPKGFDSGATGFGQHYGVALADNMSGKFLRNFVFAAASRRRDDYEPTPGEGIWKRVGRAGWHSLFSSNVASIQTFNWSGIPASFAAAGLSNVYQPVEQRTLSATMVRVGTNSLGYFAGSVVLEFTKKPTQTRPLLGAFNKRR